MGPSGPSIVAKGLWLVSRESRKRTPFRRDGPMELNERSAIVTGGAGGLGAATVRHLVHLGMGVAIFDMGGDRAKELSGELGNTTAAVGGDVNDDGDVQGAIEAAQALGTLSLVVNVAGGGLGG